VKAGETEDPSVPGATELRLSIVRSLTDSARGHLAKARVDDALRDLRAAEELDAGPVSAVKSSFVDEVLEATRSPQCDQIAQVEQRIQVASRVIPKRQPPWTRRFAPGSEQSAVRRETRSYL
jgi:hypothetical protein